MTEAEANRELRPYGIVLLHYPMQWIFKRRGFVADGVGLSDEYDLRECVERVKRAAVTLGWAPAEGS